MSKAVLMSIQPRWCELIANGKKTVEVRKIKPKLETPFKVYIYCTLPPKEELFTHGCIREYAHELIRLQDGQIVYDYGMRLCCDIENRSYSQDNFLCKKVIGEFVCNEIEEYECEFYDDDEQPVFEAIYEYDFNDDADDTFCYIQTSNDRDYPDDCSLCENSCLSFQEIRQYMNFKCGNFYAWHISDLVIYDKPKELSEFKKINRDCWYADLGLAKRDCPECKNKECFMSRPPQSWCYVEEWIS